MTEAASRAATRPITPREGSMSISMPRDHNADGRSALPPTRCKLSRSKKRVEGKALHLRRGRSKHQAAGFTLTEVLVAALLGGLILTGVLTTNLQLLRSGVRITQYAEMSSQIRRG